MTLSDPAVVTKVGLAVVRDGRLLLVRRVADRSLILPGGKPNKDESDLAALAREISEELSCRLDVGSVRFLGHFVDELADDPERSVHVRLYMGEIVGAVRPAAEIQEVVWHPVCDTTDDTLAPSLRRQILPALIES